MTPAKVPVSVVIPVKNEEQNLARCLAALEWADEIWVVDSDSEDQTGDVAVAGGAHVVQFKFNGVWPKKKNWALENISFKHEWVLIVDADEVFPPGAEREIREKVTDGGDETAGYWINRRFMFMGGWLRHAYYPNWNLRLFKHRLGRYERLANGPTNSGDNEVHEHIVVKGKTERLRVEMDHYAFPTIEAFVEKHNRYSNWEAMVAMERRGGESRVDLQDREVSRRRSLKWWSHHLPMRPFLRFLYVYIWQAGFLDGRRGFYFARLHGVYELLSVLKKRELEWAEAAGVKAARSRAPDNVLLSERDV